jgi:transposase
MAMTIVEAAPGIVGGVDTHLDVHAAAALDPLGKLIGTESFVANAAGYKALLDWLEGFGQVTKVGVEGTGSYGVGLARFLRRRDIGVVEVNRPNRQARRNQGKSDPLDAVEAARAALSGRVAGAGKTMDGPVEAIRVLVVAKRSARQARVKALTQMRHLGFGAPDQLHCRLKGLSVPKLIAEGKRLRPTSVNGHQVLPTVGHVNSPGMAIVLPRCGHGIPHPLAPGSSGQRLHPLPTGGVLKSDRLS